MEIEVRRSRRRTKSIRVDSRTAKVVVSVPLHTTELEVRNFIDEYRPWIEKTILKVKRNSLSSDYINVCDNGSIMYLGQQYLLKFDQNIKSSCISENTLYIKGKSPVEEVTAFLKKSISSICVEYIAKYSQTMGVFPSKISITSARSRWGSCCKDRVNFSFRLAMAPLYAIEYVVVHELAHMKEMNHSPAFYAVVAKYYPTYKLSEKWLKANGPLLGKL